jgi:hypothetical protein
MYIRSVTPGSYSVNLDYLIVDSLGSYSVPTVLVYPASYTASAADIYADETLYPRQAVVVSTDATSVEINGLDYGTRYTLVLGNVTMSGSGDDDSDDLGTATFEKLDLITFKTTDLDLSLQVTSLTKDAITVESSLSNDFQMKQNYFFYVVVYDQNQQILAYKKLEDTDLQNLKSSSGYTQSIAPASDFSHYGVNITVAMCYGTGDVANKQMTDITAEQKKYIMISNPFGK